MNDELAQLYQSVILEHNRSPRNHGPLVGASHEGTADNPLCGDRVTLRLLMGEGGIAAARFEARGCALSRAAGSLLTEAVAGLTSSEALALGERFAAFLAGDAAAPSESLAVFGGVRAFPSRIACAALPWKALATALRAPRR
jgi:nitrogen fixation NifU-like protein